MRRKVQNSRANPVWARNSPVLSRCLAALALAACVLAAACRNGAPDRFETAPLTPPLHQMLNEVAAVRGLDPPPALEAGTVSRLDVPALLEQQLTPTDREWFDTTTTLYRLLGHLGPEQDYFGVFGAFGAGAIVGLYSPLENRLWVVQREPAIDLSAMSPGERSTLAHELVHAIQDYHFSLDALAERTAPNLDWGLAASSVIEGDAITAQGLWDARQVTLPGGARLFLATGAGAAAVPASMEREFRFPYTTGAEWANIVRSTEGTPALDRYLAGEPISTAHILHPELREAGWQPETPSLPGLSGAAGEDWSRQSGGTLGEFHLRNYLQLRLPALPAVTAAAGWRGDHYDVYVRGGESAAVFRVRFADSQEASEFSAAQSSMLAAAGAQPVQTGSSTTSVLGDGRTTIQLPAPAPGDVLFVIGSSLAVAERLAAAVGGG